jgi:hypothetical protein
MKRKSSIYLTERELSHLASLSRQEGRPQAEIIRDAIVAYPGRRAGARTFAIDGVGEGPGDSVADLPDDELLEGFGDDAAG